MEKVYEASHHVTFDPELMGINVFTIEYPKTLTGFIVQGLNDTVATKTWFLLILEKNGTKLGEGCFAPESKMGHPFFCPLSIPFRHSLKYVSVTNQSLWIHTFFQDSVHDKPIETCYLMNDCYGCVLFSMRVNFDCKWDTGQCSSSPKRFPEKPRDCIAITDLHFVKSILIITLQGVILTNSFMQICLKMTNGECISAFEKTDDQVRFALDQKGIEEVEQNPSKIDLIVSNQEFNIDVRIPLKDESWHDAVVAVLFILSLFLLAFFIMIFVLYFINRQKRKNIFASIESLSFSTIRGPVGETKSNKSIS